MLRAERVLRFVSGKTPKKPKSRICAPAIIRLPAVAAEENLPLEEWYLDGHLHREDGPAVLYPDGVEVWYQHGQLHREDGPAIVYPDGSEDWYQHGQLHREDAWRGLWPKNDLRIRAHSKLFI